MPSSETKSVFVVSAHAADFVWRAGGAIALYAKRGYHVRMVCLDFEKRGVQGKRNSGRDMVYGEAY